MKKNNFLSMHKGKLILALFVVMVIAVIASFSFTSNPVKASSFDHQVIGASVRLPKENEENIGTSIRFTYVVDMSNSVFEENLSNVQEMGVLVNVKGDETPTVENTPKGDVGANVAYISAYAQTDNKYNVCSYDGTKYVLDENGTFAVMHVYVYNIPFANLHSDLACVGYYKLKDAVDYEYTTVDENSIANVANIAIDDVNSGLLAEDITTLKTLLSSSTDHIADTTSGCCTLCGDITAPEISFLEIKTNTLVNENVRLPAITVNDNVDGKITTNDSVYTTTALPTNIVVTAKSPSGSNVTVKSVNKYGGGIYYQIKPTAAGEYVMTVDATDAAGNVATKTLTITASATLDDKDMPITTFDAKDTLATTATNAIKTEWLESDGEKTGIAKYTFAPGVETVQMGFSSFDWASTSIDNWLNSTPDNTKDDLSYRYYMDFIKLNVKFEFVADADDTATYDNKTGVGIVSGNSWINRDADFALTEWKELTLYAKDFIDRGSGTFLGSSTSNNDTILTQLYTMYNSKHAELDANNKTVYVNNESITPNDIFHVRYPYWGENKNYSIPTSNIQVIMYVDSVSIGMDAEAPVIDDTALTKTGTVGQEFSLTSISITDNSDNAIPTNSSDKIPYCIKNFMYGSTIGGCKYEVYKYDGEVKGDAVTVTDNGSGTLTNENPIIGSKARTISFTPETAGDYLVVVTAKDYAGNETIKEIKITISDAA